MKCMDSIISFYIYLENESDANPNQNFVSWLQLGDRGVNIDTETASVKALSLSLICLVRHKVSLE